MPVRLSVWVVVGEYLLCDSNAHIRTETPTTTTTSLSTPRIGDRCVKCGIYKKSGKRSCCARGGDWFKNCGDAGDTQFNHTWAEGIQACEDFATIVSLESPRQDMFRHGGVVVHPLHAPRSRNTSQAKIDLRDTIFNAGTQDSKVYVGFAKVTASMCVVVMIS